MENFKVGDRVVYCTVKYSELSLGIILKLTPKGVTIDKGISYKYSPNQINRNRDQFVKVGEGTK